MDAYRQMELHKDELTPRELSVYEAIINNDELVRGSSSTELARALGISQSVISRFCQKIGFSGYGDFRMNLYQVAGKLEGRGEKSNDERDIADYYADALYEVRRTLPDSLLEELAEKVLAASDIYLSGYGASAIPASFLGTLLTQDAQRAHVVSPGDEVGVLHYSSEHDLFFLFSLMNPSHKDFVTTTHELNPQSRPHTVLISGTPSHPLRGEVDEMIVLPSWSTRHHDTYLPPTYATTLFCMLLSHAVSERASE